MNERKCTQVMKIHKYIHTRYRIEKEYLDRDFESVMLWYVFRNMVLCSCL